MSKLYPPQIENKLPATYINNLNTFVLTIPLRKNKMVSDKEYTSIWLVIKSSSGETIKYKKEFKGIKAEENQDTGLNEIVCSDIDNSIAKLQKNAFYRVQIAYGNEQGAGYWSNVGIVKITEQPQIFIEGRENNLLHTYNYKGVYQNVDRSEKVYRYRFILTNATSQIITTSGWQLHVETDEIEEDKTENENKVLESCDIWEMTYVMNPSEVYYIFYQVETYNGMIVSTKSYQIIPVAITELKLGVQLVGQVDNERGSVKLQLEEYMSKEEKEEFVGTFNGTYIILRSDSKDNFTTQTRVGKIQLTSSIVSGQTVLNDYTLENGVQYTYFLQAENKYGLRTQPIQAGTYIKNKETQEYDFYPAYFITNYEHIYLSDGERQLIVKYNPKISSFKTTVLETKVDTIGGQYPVFFRNGNTNYKEFPISGLISMLMDEEGEFIKDFIFINPSIRNSTPSAISLNTNTMTDLVSSNIRKEKEFKIQVLNWLNNGQPKLFRSATEGNYIVRLMNVSLTPNEILGRMLHTFTCTAYEIAEANLRNLIDYNFLRKTVELESFLTFYSKTFTKTNQVFNAVSPIKYLQFTHTDYNEPPKVKLTYEDATTQIFVLGSTGTYLIPSSVLIHLGIIKIECLNNKNFTFTYGYLSDYIAMGQNFDYIQSVLTRRSVNQIFGYWSRYELLKDQIFTTDYTSGYRVGPEFSNRDDCISQDLLEFFKVNENNIQTKNCFEYNFYCAPKMLHYWNEVEMDLFGPDKETHYFSVDPIRNFTEQRICSTKPQEHIVYTYYLRLSCRDQVPLYAPSKEEITESNLFLDKHCIYSAELNSMHPKVPATSLCPIYLKSADDTAEIDLEPLAYYDALRKELFVITDDIKAQLLEGETIQKRMYLAQLEYDTGSMENLYLSGSAMNIISDFTGAELFRTRGLVEIANISNLKGLYLNPGVMADVVAVYETIQYEEESAVSYI